MNVLFLTHRLPYAPNRGDRIRAYHLLQHLSTFARVSLFSLVHDDEEAAAAESMPFASQVVTARVRPLGNRVRAVAHLGTRTPLTHLLLDAPDAARALSTSVQRERPDVVLAYCSSMVKWAMRAPLSDWPFVLDMVDVDSAKWRELATHGSWPRRWIYQREAATLSAFEADAARRARTTLVVNDREASLMRQLAPDADVRVVPNGIDVAGFAREPGTAEGAAGPDPSAPATVVFCGVMNYEPNIVGVQWLASHVWPRVRQSRPDARFLIVGADPPQRILDLARRDPSIEVTGRVERVQPYLWRSAISVAPLQVARGLQNKVIEALAAGLPVVATHAVIEGLPAEALPGCAEANSEADFTERLLHLLSLDPAGRRAIAARACLDTLGWGRSLAPLRAILENAARLAS